MNTEHSRKSRFGDYMLVAAVAGTALILLATPAFAGAKSPHEHPLIGSCKAVVTPVSQEGPTSVLHLELSCHYAGIGVVTGEATQRVTPVGPPAGENLPVMISTDITYTAKSGDQFASLFTGGGNLNLNSLDVTFAGTETIVAGTGNFALITGWSVAVGAASTATNTGEFTVGGQISY
jgi:hypothetical protein